MQKWLVALCLSLVLGLASAQENDAAKANELYAAGRKVDALPLYEELAQKNPSEMLYQERLADCLGAESAQLTDPAQIKAMRTRMRDAARRAIALGDKARFVQLFADADPNDVPYANLPSAGAELLREGEKAYTAGDFTLAMQKYTAAAEADPQFYDAALYAGDTAYVERDLSTAATWFARAIAIDPDRETAYRYWGDAILKFGNDPDAAKEKYIAAIVAEPYKQIAWQGIENWAARTHGTLSPPKIDRPAPPTVDPKNPNTTTINIDFGSLDEKKNPAGSAWMTYSIVRASYHGDLFKQKFPNEKQYRHTLMEEDSALSIVASTIAEKKIKRDKLDESLRNLVDLQQAGMLDCWILINAADEGIAQDYAVYRKDHRQLLHDYLARFVIHGGAAQ